MNKEKWGEYYNELIEQGYDEKVAGEMTDIAIADEAADYGDWLYEQEKDRRAGL